MVAGQFAIQASSGAAPPVVADAVDACVVRFEALRQAGITRNQIDTNLVAPRMAQARDQALQQAPGPALHQQDGPDFGQAAGKEIAH